MTETASSNPAGRMVEFWMQCAADIWQQSINHMAAFQAAPEKAGTVPFKLKAVPRPSAQSEEKDNSERPEDAWRELIAKMGNNTLKAFMKMQKDLLEKSANTDTLFGQAPFENAVNWIYSASLESFEKDLSKILQVPALGLTRLYQEKMNRALGTYESFNTALSRFLRLFSRPFESSLAEVRKMSAELTEGDQDPKTLYRRWIKRLETDFMNLFKSPQYLEAMSGALASYQEFAQARSAVFEDMLKTLPIPTNSDMDELYKEVYQLKKKLKEFEKQFRPLRSAS